jgi:hypothetical protein
MMRIESVGVCKKMHSRRSRGKVDASGEALRRCGMGILANVVEVVDVHHQIRCQWNLYLTLYFQTGNRVLRSWQECNHVVSPADRIQSGGPNISTSVIEPRLPFTEVSRLVRMSPPLRMRT